MSKIKCYRCDKDVNVPGTKHGANKCDYCGVKNWGRKSIIEEHNASDNTIAQVLQSIGQEGLSNEEKKWLESWQKDIKEEEEADNDNNNSVLGWLIVHTKGKDPKTFDLKLGKNTIGDERGTSIGNLDITVGGDRYVSRFHALINVVKKDNNFYFFIEEQKPSTNGTYINGDSNRIIAKKKIRLNDGDAIQVGETTLRLKTKQYSKDIEDAKTQVLNLDYEKTIIINN